MTKEGYIERLDEATNLIVKLPTVELDSIVRNIMSVVLQRLLDNLYRNLPEDDSLYMDIFRAELKSHKGYDADWDDNEEFNTLLNAFEVLAEHEKEEGVRKWKTKD